MPRNGGSHLAGYQWAVFFPSVFQLGGSKGDFEKFSRFKPRA